jgi:hypothetical protein
MTWLPAAPTSPLGWRIAISVLARLAYFLPNLGINLSLINYF